MTDQPSLNRRQFLGLLAAALGVGTAGVVELLTRGGTASHAARQLAGGSGGGAGGAPSTSVPASSTAGGAGRTSHHEQQTRPTTAAEPPAPLPVDQRTLVLITLYGG